MEKLRTPEDRFANLPDYDFAPNYLEVDGLRLHYLDEGPKDGKPILLMHGEPSWSYLYRKMIPPLVAAGYRVLAPDLIGFGKSDKPTDRSVYTYQSHVDWITAWFKAMQLNEVVLFGQDWGSLIGLRLAAENEAQFSHIAIGNGILPTGSENIPKVFALWQLFAARSPWFSISAIINMGTTSKLSKVVKEAYDAPFPSAKYKAGARAFPALVPTTADDPAAPANLKAWEVLEQWEKPFLCCFSDKDPVLGHAWKVFQKRVPGTQGQPHVTIKNAGHFLQEDKGEEIAATLIDWLAG